ncbi:BTAD domain-containing putative transcriptional regulator [Streptomyces sp. 5-6(2022)]|uniref:AfsR/SARP family transcriptional regulator n=1 Tax=Streptomyces sp. 5-6(2022) TaxID=2936510 RepID=UPI0023B9CAF3|nr:BTAD domain-containing putative transcriptional regulator [Streptomyces sp. 5-6(2022)]
MFLAVYANVAARLGEPEQVTARQFHRWREPDPPYPGPSSQRVLEDMFGAPLEHLGFPLPQRHRGPSASGGADSALRFAVLGPVRIWRGEQALPVLRPLERAVLCVLLLRGRAATAGELVDGVWGDAPPPQAIASLRTHAFRLRRALGPGVLVSEAGGYALRIRPGALDLTVCESYEARAERATAEGELTGARKLLHMAAELWEGQPLAGVPGPYAEAQRARLEQWRLSLLEARLELDLELGLHTDAVSELTALTAEHPLRERLRTLLMTALYRSGRQAEALGVYTDTRRLLSEELGVAPSAELARLHQRILRADPTLAGPRRLPAGAKAVPTASPSPAPRPAQLPAKLADFTGRAAVMDTLRKRLPLAQGTVMAISVVQGLGGVGKTALAVCVAQEVRERFPDGQLFVDLIGHNAQPADPAAVLGTFLRALGTPPAEIPEGLQERAALYRSVLADRRVLVLLDNAHDTAQVRPLLPGSPSCATLITSRAPMTGLDGAHVVDLSTMAQSEALALFTRIIGDERAAAEPHACRQAVAACGYLPLAIRIAAARLTTRPAWTVRNLTDRLADAHRRLHELRAGDLAVKTSFEFGYAQLGPSQARAFRLLALAYGPDISLAAATAILGVTAQEAERLLESLVDTSLLHSPEPGRYRYHDLVRIYARDRAERDEPPAGRAAAMSRMRDFYVASAARVYAMGRPGDRLVGHLLSTDHPGQDFGGARTALDWLLSEADCLLTCAQQGAKSPERGAVRRAADLLLVTRDLVESGTHYLQYEAAARSVGHAAHIAGDTAAEGRARLALAGMFPVTRGQQQADDDARRAGLLATAAGDLPTACHAVNVRGVVAIYQQRYDDAETHLREALRGFRADDNLACVAGVLSNLSRVHAATGRADSAVDLAARGVDLRRSLGSTWRIANGQLALGIALHRAGRHAAALTELLEALNTFRDNRQRLWEGSTHARLAEVYLAANHPAEAATHAEQALALGSIGNKWRRGSILSVLGQALERLGQPDRARACRRKAEMSWVWWSP